MTKAHIPDAKDLSRLLFYTIRAFYLERIPGKQLRDVCNLHLAQWKALLAGEAAADEQQELVAYMDLNKLDACLIEECDAEVVWTLTPEFAAFVACSPGEERVNLRNIRAALENLLVQMRAHMAPVGQFARAA